MIFETTSIFKVENSEKQKFKNCNPEPTPGGNHQEPLSVHFRTIPFCSTVRFGPCDPGTRCLRLVGACHLPRSQLVQATRAPRCPASRRHSPSAGFPGSKPSPTPNKEPPGAGSTIPFPMMGLLSTFWGAGPGGMDPGVVSAARSLARHFRNGPLPRSILESQEAGRPLLSTSSPPNQGQTSAPWSPSSLNEHRVTPGGHGEPSPGDHLTPPPSEEACGHPGWRDLAVAGGPPETLIRAQWGGLSWG